MATAVRDTRLTLLLAASELFRKQGYGATTMQQVAESLGISKGNLTYHFPSKRSLYEAVHGEGVAYIMDRIMTRSFDEAPDTLTGLDDFTRRLRRMLLDADGHFVGCLFTNIAVETQHSDAAIAALSRSALVTFKHFLSERLAIGQARGEIRTDLYPDDLARAFFWMYEGALTLARAWDDPAEYDAFRGSLRRWLTAPA